MGKRYKRTKKGNIIMDNKDYKGNPTKGSFRITLEEQKEIKSLVRKVNKKSEKMLSDMYNNTSAMGIVKQLSPKGYANTLFYKGLATPRISGDLSQFKSKADLKRFLNDYREIAKKDYGNNRTQELRDNMIFAVKYNYGNKNSKELQDLINNFSPNELVSFYAFADGDLLREIFYPESDPYNAMNDAITQLKRYQASLSKYREKNKRDKTDTWENFKKKSKRKKYKGQRFY